MKVQLYSSFYTREEETKHKKLNFLTHLKLVWIKQFMRKQPDRMWLCVHNSGTESGRELFKGSKDTEIF